MSDPAAPKIDGRDMDGRGRGNGRGEWLKRHGKWLIILPPMLYLLVFFLIPFGFALMISFSETAVRVPPFTDILSVSPDWHIHLSLNLGNFQYLFTDEVYGLSYVYSLKTAFFSTVIDRKSVVYGKSGNASCRGSI